MNICEGCHAELSDTNEYCEYCGSAKSKRSNWSYWIAIGLGVLNVVLLGGSAVLAALLSTSTLFFGELFLIFLGFVGLSYFIAGFFLGYRWPEEPAAPSMGALISPLILFVVFGYLTSGTGSWLPLILFSAIAYGGVRLGTWRRRTVSPLKKPKRQA